jgi:aryl-alcohol dehydrogenase-like predicted oxidoreductase
MTPSLDEWVQKRAANTSARLVLGTMNFGKRTPKTDAIRLVHHALEEGIVHFDTANAYVDGESERILGEALGDRRAEALVATKVGLSRIGGTTSGLIQTGGRSEGLSAARIVAACEESLGRLRTDYIDLYFLHVPDHTVALEESLLGIQRLLNTGKIRGWASSNYASWQLLEMLQQAERIGIPRPVLSQQMYNLLVRQLDVEYFAFAANYRLHTTAYNPLAGGLLAGHHQWGPPTVGSRFDDNPMYQRRYFSEAMLQRVEDYRAVAAELGLSLASLSMAWLNARSDIDSIVIGPGTLAHLVQAIESTRVVLDSTTLGALDELYTKHMGSDARYVR